VRLYVLDMAPGLLLTPKVRCSVPLYYGTHLPATLHNCGLNLTSLLCPNTGYADFVFAVDPSTSRPYWIHYGIMYCTSYISAIDIFI
jgi:hypothetical protein